jgi:Flp pilus assembly secretin CpaC/tetratricopeptide (TPR) repeat protein
MQTTPQALEVSVRQPSCHAFGRWPLRQWSNFWTATLLLLAFPGLSLAQTAETAAQTQALQGQAAQSGATGIFPAQDAPLGAASAAVLNSNNPVPGANNQVPKPGQAQESTPAKPVHNADRRRAAKLYLACSKLFLAERFEEAMRGYEQAARLDPGNADYPLAASVARSHAVTAEIQAAAKARLRGDAASARAALAHALELDPKNPLVSEHLYELREDALLGHSNPVYEQGAERVGEAVELEPTAGVHSFHLRTDQRQIIRQVFKAYGIETTVDDSVRSAQAHLDVDNVGFEAATRILGMVTDSFYVPLDAHRALVASDTRENRQQFERQEMETVYLPGLTAAELTEAATLAKSVFNAQQAVAEPTAGTITLRAPGQGLKAFNATMSQLLDGKNQVLLEVRLIQLAHTNTRDTGVQLPQSVSAFNVYSEEQSILNANASTVKEIISSGLASASDPLAILGILIAAGDVSGSMFSNGLALFGGGLTQSALAPGSVTANLSLNSSDSRELDQIQLRLGDGEEGMVRMGERYPIQTSSFSSLSSSASSIAGLTAAGTSSALSALLASYASSVPNIPMVEYQDLGLTLKATPKVMRNDDVALTLDMKIDALSGTTLNGNPELDNRAYSGVVTLRRGETVAVVSEMDKSQSRAISGTPGISEIPGLNILTGNDAQKNYATLLILITPHVIRGTQAAGHSPMMRVERGQEAH